MASNRLARSVLAAAFATLWISALACGGGEEPTETEPAPAPEMQTGSRKVTLPNASGDLEVANISSGEMSEDFPEDIPAPPDSRPHMSMFMPGQGGMATFVSSAARNDLRDFYAEGLAGEGWDVEDPSEEDVRTVIKASKGSRTANVIIANGPKGSEVMISIEGG